MPIIATNKNDSIMSNIKETVSNKLNIRFASIEEGQQLIQRNTHYYHRLTQMDLDWRCMKQGATLDELIPFAQSNVLNFTARDKNIIMQTVEFIEHRLDEFECRLPLPGEVIFIKTNMEDESNAAAYTSGNMIFLKYSCLERRSSFLRELITHELFHIITRHSPEFRQKMYSLIGFTVMDHNIEFPERIKRRIMANPDVEHIDNYAEFTIDGVKRKCALVAYFAKSWAEASKLEGPLATFFNNYHTVLLPLDELDHPYSYSAASDFWDKLGRNTTYVSAPEECLAVNFSYAVVYGPDQDYRSPQLIRSILSALK